MLSEKVRLQYFDDLDGAPLDVDDLQAVTWSWAGVNYHLDISTANLERIETGYISMAMLLVKSVRSDTLCRAASSTVDVYPSGAGPSEYRVNLGEVRRWALVNHYNGVANRGRLSRDIIAAYNRAH